MHTENDFLKYFFNSLENFLNLIKNIALNFIRLPEWSFKWRGKLYAKTAEEMSSPRLFKSHLPVQLLPDEIWAKKPKIFHVSRDVKDVAVSQFYLSQTSKENKFTMDDFLKDFLNDGILYNPYREHLWNYLNLPDYSNIQYFTYEEISADLEAAVYKVAKFLGKTVSAENVKKIMEYLKFENMKGIWIFFFFRIFI